MRRLVRRVQHALIDFIAWIDGTSRDPNHDDRPDRQLTDWASNHVAPPANDPWALWADDELPPGMTAADRILLRDGVIRLPDGAPTLDEWRRRAGEAGQR